MLFRSASYKLASLYDAFVNADNPIYKRYYFNSILLKLTGADKIDVSSRGGNYNARNLHVVETFLGREFVGADGKNPNANAAGMLNNLYKDIEKTYYLNLLMKTDFSDICNTVFEYEDKEGNKHLDMSIFNLLNICSLMDNENIDTTLYDMSIFLNEYDHVNGTSYFFPSKSTVI